MLMMTMLIHMNSSLDGDYWCVLCKFRQKGWMNEQMNKINKYINQTITQSVNHVQWQLLILVITTFVFYYRKLITV